MAEHCTPDQIIESSPRSFSIGSKIGDYHHQLNRPAYRLDAREIRRNWQGYEGKKLAFDLPEEIYASSIENYE